MIMVKEYDKELLKTGVLKFESKLLCFNEKISMATISLPFPTIKMLNINKDTEMCITIKPIKNE